MAIFAAVLLIALSTAGCAGKSEETAVENENNRHHADRQHSATNHLMIQAFKV